MEGGEMVRKTRNLLLVVASVSISFLLSACGSMFAEGDPYYYVLHQITGKDYQNDIQLYIIDPFEGKVIVGGEARDLEDIPDLEEYEDTESSLYIKYGEGETDRFEKKSDSLWVSLNSGVEYDAKRKEGEFDYTPVKYDLPWEDDYKAKGYLSAQRFTKHTGDGAERLLFLDDHTLILAVEDTLPPYVEDLEDFKESKGYETIEFKNIEFKDVGFGEFLIIYEGKELLRLRINEENLLETEDETTYMKD